MVERKGRFLEFRFFRPDASRAFLAGDFNRWSVGDLPMRRTGRGYWKARLRLPSGTDRFRYWADGQLYCDYTAFGIVYGAYGPDGVVEIGAQRQRVGRSPGNGNRHTERRASSIPKQSVRDET